MSNTIKDKVDYLKTTKAEIKAALQVAGADIKDDTPFRQYAEKITNFAEAAGTAEDLAILQGVDFIDIVLYGGGVRSTAEYQAALDNAKYWMQLHLYGEVTNE